MNLRSQLNSISLFVAFKVVFIILVGTGCPQAGEVFVKAGSNETAVYEDFRNWLDVLRKEAQAAGISDTTLDAALNNVKLATRVIERDRRQSEFTQTFSNYLGRCVTEERIKRGRELLAKHQKLLNEIHAQFNVPPRYLIAFWGIETNFGDYLGSFPVIDTLVTLAYDRRRTHFFRAQLLDALQIIENGHITPSAMKGSWAGAMGQMQFMPSTFVNYAIDFTDDGRKDIWHSLPDAFSSAANYLSSIGWRHGQLWGREVLLPDGFDLMDASIGTKKTVEEWSSLGVRRANGNDLPQMKMEGSIVLPQGHKGPAFLVYDNFRVILQWNRSVNYALCVGHLADRIVGLPQIANAKRLNMKTLSRFQIKEMQGILNFLGYGAGSADGLLGPRTQAAVRFFQVEHSLPADGYPTLELLHLLRAQAGELL